MFRVRHGNRDLGDSLSSPSPCRLSGAHLHEVTGAQPGVLDVRSGSVDE